MDLLKTALLLAACIASFNVCSRDLGQYGNHVYDIAEEDLMEVMKNNVNTHMTNGDVGKMFSELKDTTTKYVHRPPGSTLPRVLLHTVTHFDPTITMSEDIYDAEGNTVIAAGTQVNPLDYKNLTRPICFIDGDDGDQLSWVTQACPNDADYMVVLVNGDVVATTKLLNRKIYFDQKAVLIEHFRIDAVPTVISQNGRLLNVEKFPVR